MVRPKRNYLLLPTSCCQTLGRVGEKKGCVKSNAVFLTAPTHARWGHGFFLLIFTEARTSRFTFILALMYLGTSYCIHLACYPICLKSRNI